MNRVTGEVCLNIHLSLRLSLRARDSGNKTGCSNNLYPEINNNGVNQTNCISHLQLWLTATSGTTTPIFSDDAALLN